LPQFFWLDKAHSFLQCIKKCIKLC